MPDAALRAIEPSYVAPGSSGVTIRTRLKGLTRGDERMLELVGAHLGSLASKDLKTRCAQRLGHSADSWAVRKRDLTPLSSSRWAGSLTKATHDQWALARRCQLAHIKGLEAGIRMLRHRLSQPVGAKGTKKTPGGYRSKHEWFTKSRRLGVLENRLVAARAEWDAGIVRVARGGKRLLNTRHHLEAAQIDTAQWRTRWEAERWFCQADGESGKPYGNETIRVTPDGEVSIKLPAPLTPLANAPRGRYVLSGRVRFAHRGEDWTDRVETNRAVAYRIHYDVQRGRWYLTASWQRRPDPTISLTSALAEGVIGVDMNADHLATWRLDTHGNPIGHPRRFPYDLTGPADRRDAQIRHALTRLLHWALACNVRAIAIEDLDFAAERTREKHGRKRRFRRLVSGMPTAGLKARLTSMADAAGITIVAVDPAYTSKWGAQHWQKPLNSRTRKTTRHDAAAVAIGRRAQGHPIRRRTTPPPHDRSDRAGHRTVQAGPGALGREETRPRVPGPRTRSVPPGRRVKAGDQRPQNRSGHAAEHEPWQQEPLPLGP
ncbi:IS200/IS605 family accessory protein TnpB-related protein [Streptomyces sp. NPDC055721]|uniref:IS200/IS605 family accessory protein TnpB-related protein n=1 Tax=Streptomyces sp. NPDC127132 TaxID=3345374 RepID=UPI0036361401